MWNSFLPRFAPEFGDILVGWQPEIRGEHQPLPSTPARRAARLRERTNKREEDVKGGDMSLEVLDKGHPGHPGTLDSCVGL